MNESTARILPHPILADKEMPKIEPTLSWFSKRLLDLGIKTMSQPIKPYWSTTMVTAWVAVLGLIVLLLSSVGGLYVYTRDTSKADGILIGIQTERDRATQERLKDQADEINTLKKATGLMPPDKKEKK